MSVKQEYLLISSDYRSPDSVSTTNFHVRLNVPLKNVIKTDLVQLAMDVNMANVKAPNNEVKIGTGQFDVVTGQPIFSTLVIQEGLYSKEKLAAKLQEQLIHAQGPGYSVYYTVEGCLVFELLMTEPNDGNYVYRPVTASAELCYMLRFVPNQSLAIIMPQFIASNGLYGSFRWAFALPVRLKEPPYFFIQSQALGTTTTVANGTMGFWRMVLNDSSYSLKTVNNRWMATRIHP